MKIRVEVKLPGAEPFVQIVNIGTHAVRENSWTGCYELREAHELRAVADKRVRRIQKRYPTAEVSWREVEES